MTDEEFRSIALAEYAYWRDCSEKADNGDQALIQMGAMGAAANIHAALTGKPAAWHPKPASNRWKALSVYGFFLLEIGILALVIWLSTLLGVSRANAIEGGLFGRAFMFMAQLRAKGVI